MQKKPYNLKK